MRKLPKTQFKIHFSKKNQKKQKYQHKITLLDINRRKKPEKSRFEKKSIDKIIFSLKGLHWIPISVLFRIMTTIKKDLNPKTGVSKKYQNREIFVFPGCHNAERVLNFICSNFKKKVFLKIKNPKIWKFEWSFHFCGRIYFTI